MPFVRLYIYHENDLFSLIPLFCVTNKNVRLLCSDVLWPFAYQLVPFLLWLWLWLYTADWTVNVNLQASLLFAKCYFFSVSPPHSSFRVFFIYSIYFYKTINISMPLVLFLRSLVHWLRYCNSLWLDLYTSGNKLEANRRTMNRRNETAKRRKKNRTNTNK